MTSNGVLTAKDDFVAVDVGKSDTRVLFVISGDYSDAEVQAQASMPDGVWIDLACFCLAEHEWVAGPLQLPGGDPVGYIVEPVCGFTSCRLKANAVGEGTLGVYASAIASSSELVVPAPMEAKPRHAKTAHGTEAGAKDSLPKKK